VYLARIEAYDKTTTATHLHSYIYVNPRAVHEASEGADDHANKPLRGIPIVLKDNINHVGLRSASSALRGSGRGSYGLKPYPASEL
jgi:Asp-tRNA(Asn)/Glu-tRNA(Gln) amidotransferase A subunit family amidase